MYTGIMRKNNNNNILPLQDVSIKTMEETTYLVIFVHGDVHPGRQPSVALVVVLSPFCLQFFPVVHCRQPQLVDVEAMHVIVERDAVSSTAEQSGYRDTATRANIVTYEAQRD